MPALTTEDLVPTNLPRPTRGGGFLRETDGTLSPDPTVPAPAPAVAPAPPAEE